MANLIDKDTLVAEIKKFKAEALQKKSQCKRNGLEKIMHQISVYNKMLSFIDTLEVKDPYEQCVQYDSIKAGIQAHAETYSFNIESELFNQLTKEQQVSWRKEIEQACISGGDVGYSLARDIRYKENVKVKEVDLEEELESWRHNHFHGRRDKEAAGEYLERSSQLDIAKHFFELGLNAQYSSINIPNIDDILEEEGIDPFSKEAKIFKESYYMALEKFKEKKGEKL